MNSGPDGGRGGLGPDAAPPDSGLFSSSLGGNLGGASSASNNGGNRFFQMLVGGNGGASQDRSAFHRANVSSSSRNSSFDLNDFPSLGDQSHPQIGGVGFSGGSSGGTSATDFAAALSRAATGGSSSSGVGGSGAVSGLSLGGGSISSPSAVSAPGMNGWSASGGGGVGVGNNNSGLGGNLGLGVGVSHGQNFSMASEDFPALPGAPPGSGLRTDGGSLLSSVNGAVGTSSTLSPSGFANNLLAAAAGLPSSGASSSASHQQFQMQQQQQHQRSHAGSGLLHSSLNSGGNNNSSSSGPNPYHSTSYNNSTSGSGMNHRQPHASSAPSSPQMQPQANSPSVRTAGGSTTNNTVLSSEYGMLGLRSVLRGASSDSSSPGSERNALTQGSDLTLLGMNMNSADPLYRTFAGPFADAASIKALLAGGNGGRIEPMYQIPSCYYIQAPALKTGHLARFQLETLFYIFYALPQDVQQAYAAQELYARDWRYHGELKVWFKLIVTSSSEEDNASVGSSASNSQQQQHQHHQQQHQLVYFDTSTWEKRLYSNTSSLSSSNGSSSKSMNGASSAAPIHPSIIASGFLTEQEVRVRVTAGVPQGT